MSDNEDTLQNKNITNEFTKNVISWVKLDDNLRELKHKVKDIMDQKKSLEEDILSYLDEIGEKSISIGGGNLRKNVSKTKAPLKKETIFSTVREFTKDDTKANFLTSQIFENRPMTERINLKRTKLRGPKNK